MNHDQSNLPTFASVTELPNARANDEQISMLHTRYRLAGDLAAGRDVLEVACGSGIGLAHLAERANRVVGGDCDPELVEIARRQNGDRIPIHQLDAEQLPFEDGSFDVVLLLEAIYYLPNPSAFIREARRVLRPSGQLLICSANCQREDFNPSPFSRAYLSANQLRELLGQEGLHVELFGGYPNRAQGLVDHLRGLCRRVAVKLKLIPKSMKWKSRVKQLFYWRLKPLPARLEGPLDRAEALATIEPREQVSEYKVIYVIGTRKAAEAKLVA